ncbi:hypothetical protein B0H14DRAFT_3483786 [Mycena olivaceomarginata]|nr:hypothetical protein B0H14DRAFT_3483786 [Mycena olivaceomarginata]
MPPLSPLGLLLRPHLVPRPRPRHRLHARPASLANRSISNPQYYDTASDVSRGHKLTPPGRGIPTTGTMLGAAHPLRLIRTPMRANAPAQYHPTRTTRPRIDSPGHPSSAVRAAAHQSVLRPLRTITHDAHLGFPLPTIV